MSLMKVIPPYIPRGHGKPTVLFFIQILTISYPSLIEGMPTHEGQLIATRGLNSKQKADGSATTTSRMDFAAL